MSFAKAAARNDGFDITNPVQTKDGRAVRLFCTDFMGPQPVVGTIRDSARAELLWSWTEYGLSAGLDRECDLINTPLTGRRQRWVNIFRDEEGDEWETWHRDRHSAECYLSTRASSQRIACVKIDLEYDVGQGIKENNP